MNTGTGWARASTAPNASITDDTPIIDNHRIIGPPMPHRLDLPATCTSSASVTIFSGTVLQDGTSARTLPASYIPRPNDGNRFPQGRTVSQRVRRTQDH